MILINIFLLLSGFIGILTCMIILIKRNSNLVLNIYFIIPLITFSLKQLSVGLLFLTNTYTISKLNDTANFTILMLPVLHTYFKKLNNAEYKLSWKELTRKIIFPIFFALAIEYLLSNIPFTSAIKKEYVIYLFPLLFSSFYAFTSFRLLSKNIWVNKNNPLTAKNDQLIKLWSKYIYVIILVCIVKFLCILFFISYYKSEIIIYYFQILPSILVISICSKIISSPELLYGLKILEKRINENKKTKIILDSIWNKYPNKIPNSIQDKKLEKSVENSFFIYVQKIEKLALEEGYFLNSNLKIIDISNKLGIPKSRLQYFFKYHCTISFTEFKNTIRIHHATKLIQDDFLKNETLNSLSKKVGFSSYDPFYRSFKDINGCGPVDYYNYVHLNKMYY